MSNMKKIVEIKVNTVVDTIEKKPHLKGFKDWTKYPVANEKNVTNKTFI